MTILFDGFPNPVLVDGQPLSILSVDWKPLPGKAFAGWARGVVKCAQELVGVVWLRLGEPIACASLYNVGPQVRHVELGIDGTKVVRTLSPNCGIGFTNFPVMRKVWVKEFANWPKASSAPIIEAMKKSTLNPDVFVTRYTGSSNIDFYLPEAIWANVLGPCDEVAAFFDANRRWHDARPMWWIDDEAFPVNLGNATLKQGGFSEWLESIEGLNAYDVHHFDDLEQSVGFELTGCPAYLFTQVNRWCHAVANASYWRTDPSNNYAGAMRIPGNLLVSSSGLLHSLHRCFDAQWAPMVSRVVGFVRWHVKHLAKNWPIVNPWYYGSGLPEAIKTGKKDYIQDWQWARLAWGLIDASKALPLFNEDELAGECWDLACQILDSIEAHYAEHGEVFYLRSVDETVRVPGNPIAVNNWVLAPMLERWRVERMKAFESSGVEEKKPLSPLAKYLLDANVKAHGQKPEARGLVRIVGTLDDLKEAGVLA